MIDDRQIFRRFVHRAIVVANGESEAVESLARLVHFRAHEELLFTTHVGPLREPLRSLVPQFEGVGMRNGLRGEVDGQLQFSPRNVSEKKTLIAAIGSLETLVESVDRLSDDPILGVGVVVNMAVVVDADMLLRDVLHRLGRNIDHVLARDEDQLILCLVGVLPNADARALGEDLMDPDVCRLAFSTNQLATREGKGQTDSV